MTFCQVNTQPNDSPTVFERHLVSPAPEDARGNHITGTLASWAKSGNPTWSRWSSKLTRKMTTTFTHLTKAAIHHCQKKKRKKRNKILNPTRSVCGRPIVTLSWAPSPPSDSGSFLLAWAQLWKSPCQKPDSTSDPPHEAAIAHQNAPRRTVSPAITVSDSCLALHCFFLGSTPTSSRIRPSNSSGGSVFQLIGAWHHFSSSSI